MPDSVTTSTDVAAPLDRVWRALTDHREFGAWFKVILDEPFAAGRPSHGKLAEPGYKHLDWNAEVVAIEPMTRFAFRWHPYAIDPEIDYSGEPTTLVEFRLEAVPDGTRVTVTESGFDGIPAHRRADAIRMNDQGWAIQMERIRAHAEHSG